MSDRAFPWWLGLAERGGTGALAVLGHSWRLERADAPEYLTALAAGERFIYAFWHARTVTITWWRRGEGIAVLVSQHADGELIARVSERLGYVTGRGSSTRGGEAGMRDMIRWARAGRQLAVAPDGPRGPAHHVKDGLLVMASRLGRRIVPMGAAADHEWRARSWDQHRIPKPFARIVLRHAAPVAVVKDIHGDALIPARLELDAALDTVQAEASRRAGVAV